MKSKSGGKKRKTKIMDHALSITHYESQITYYRSRITDYPLRITDYRLRIPITHYSCLEESLQSQRTNNLFSSVLSQSVEERTGIF
ncbi:MAG TPA: hypothetical protein C5S37_10690 [Methanophagales archaeon]|nr:hypothetical protein [Methanophagales archaeon]